MQLYTVQSDLQQSLNPFNILAFLLRPVNNVILILTEVIIKRCRTEVSVLQKAIQVFSTCGLNS